MSKDESNKENITAAGAAAPEAGNDAAATADAKKTETPGSDATAGTAGAQSSESEPKEAA